MTSDNQIALQTITNENIEPFFCGQWVKTGRGRASRVPFSRMDIFFKGGIIRWVGKRGPNGGIAVVSLNDKVVATVDTYAPETSLTTIFEKDGLDPAATHHLAILVAEEKNPASSDYSVHIDTLEMPTPVHYAEELRVKGYLETIEINSPELVAKKTRKVPNPREWQPVPYKASAPQTGVTLGEGPFGTLFDRMRDYVSHCFDVPHYADYPHWCYWLPGSTDGRMLSGAAGVLRWRDDARMREVVEKILSDIAARQRPDGYSNYYSEEDYLHRWLYCNTERKNYDRVFWTRGLAAASLAGFDQANTILRKFYDWFNASPYLKNINEGLTTQNGHPGGGLTYFTPIGVEADITTTQQYFDENYWLEALATGEPHTYSNYPAPNGAHNYAMLKLEAFLDEYRATGDERYIRAVEGFWNIYRDHFQHLGGTTAMCECALYPPRTYYLDQHTGETCGSVFWIFINQHLLQLNPTREECATEIENSLYNVLCASQDERGYVRYHNHLHGTKDPAACRNTCCEVSATGLIGRLPELIYSTNASGIYVNLFVDSAITWRNGGDDVTLKQTTRFPYDPAVSLKLTLPRTAKFAVSVRIPSWATADVALTVNGTPAANGKPGTYVTLERDWNDGDEIAFTLPVGFRVEKYTGVNQVPGHTNRAALFYGPVLLSLVGPLGKELAAEASDIVILNTAMMNQFRGRSPEEMASHDYHVPVIAATHETLPILLTPRSEPLHFDVKGHPQHRYMPYWQVAEETFTCFPVVEK